MKYLIYALLWISLFSCKNCREKKIEDLISYWQQKEIIIPRGSIFTLWGEDTVNIQTNSAYKIISYVDSTGCISCKLQLPYWRKFIKELELHGPIPVLFIMCPHSLKEMQFILKRDSFNYPVCIDVNDSVNKLNKFPTNTLFQSFLLDKNNKVLAIGNPIHNSKIRDLYLQIIKGGKEITSNSKKNREEIETKVKVENVSISLGNFDWKKQQKVNFLLENEGDMPLIIENVTVSCGCITVKYNKEPIRQKGKTFIEVTYKAKFPEYLDKTITVYCNTDSSPIILRIYGNAN